MQPNVNYQTTADPVGFEYDNAETIWLQHRRFELVEHRLVLPGRGPSSVNLFEQEGK